jgi:hypothetical protein
MEIHNVNSMTQADWIDVVMGMIPLLNIFVSVVLTCAIIKLYWKLDEFLERNF